jgi:hypothetical protein
MHVTDIKELGLALHLLTCMQMCELLTLWQAKCQMKDMIMCCLVRTVHTSGIDGRWAWTDGRTMIIRLKPKILASVPLRLPRISHEITRDWIRCSQVRSQRQTAWAMALPLSQLYRHKMLTKVVLRKVKFFLCLIKHHATKTYGECRYGFSILDLGSWWRWVMSFTPLPLYPHGKCLWYALGRRPNGLQSRSGYCGEKKNVLTLLGIQHQFLCRPGRSPSNELHKEMFICCTYFMYEGAFSELMVLYVRVVDYRSSRLGVGRKADDLLQWNPKNRKPDDKTGRIS